MDPQLDVLMNPEQGIRRRSRREKVEKVIVSVAFGLPGGLIGAVMFFALAYQVRKEHCAFAASPACTVVQRPEHFVCDIGEHTTNWYYPKRVTDPYVMFPWRSSGKQLYSSSLYLGVVLMFITFIYGQTHVELQQGDETKRRAISKQVWGVPLPIFLAQNSNTLMFLSTGSGIAGLSFKISWKYS